MTTIAIIAAAWLAASLLGCAIWHAFVTLSGRGHQ